MFKEIQKTIITKEIQTYKDLKLLLAVILSFKNPDEFIIHLRKLVSTKLYEIENNKHIKNYKVNKYNYRELIRLIPHKKYTKQLMIDLNEKNYGRILHNYSSFESLLFMDILENQKYSYTQKRDIIHVMIKILYNGGSSRVNGGKIGPNNIPYRGFWNQFNKKGDVTEKKFSLKWREKFRKIFRYYIWEESKDEFVISSLSKSPTFNKFKLKYDTIKENKLVEFVKYMMKKNATTQNEKKNHIYICVLNKLYVYVGKASNGTRDRWGYGSGHLFEMFHYITKSGKYALPKQFVDSVILFVGPEYLFVSTLETGVNDINNYEKAYQYFFEFHKKELGIDGTLHDKLKCTSESELNEKVKKIYDTIKIGYTSFV